LKKVFAHHHFDEQIQHQIEGRKQCVTNRAGSEWRCFSQACWPAAKCAIRATIGHEPKHVGVNKLQLSSQQPHRAPPMPRLRHAVANKRRLSHRPRHEIDQSSEIRLIGKMNEYA
jgi:hypothetical protein